MKITVQQAGNPRYPRYVLALENGCFFNGEGWTPDQRQAVRYASLPIIRRDWKRLQRELDNDMIELVGSYVVRIAGTKVITRQEIEQVAWYLSGASALTLDYSLPRPAGLEHLVISTQIRWSDLRLKGQK